jgi:cytochrome P450
MAMQAEPNLSGPDAQAIIDPAHQCLGANMAGMEMKILFSELLDRIETLELAGKPIRAKSTFVRGLKALPIRYRLSE